MKEFLKKINVFNVDTTGKFIFWIIWDALFAAFDFLITKGVIGYTCGILMCVCFVIHVKRFIEYRIEQEEKIEQLVGEFMDWFPENYKKIKEKND